MLNFNEITDSVWEVNSAKAGKSVCVVGGTHGNELTGIEVVKALRDEAVNIDAGVLYLVLGNPLAIERGTRGSSAHQDLNRRFTRDVLTKSDDGTYELSRAKQLAPIFAKCDITIDIHSTNKPSEPMLLCTHFEDAYKDLFKWFNCSRVIADPFTCLIGEPSTVDDWTALNGGFGMAFESGQVSDLSKVGEIKETIYNVLKENGAIDAPVSREPYYEQWEVYDLIEPVIMTHADFRFAPGRGESSYEAFHKGDTLAYMGEEPVIAPYDGFIMFPKVKELQEIGAPVMFYAKVNNDAF